MKSTNSRGTAFADTRQLGWKLAYPLARVAYLLGQAASDEALRIVELRETQTLEVIGQSMGVTRERIRQKEATCRQSVVDIARRCDPLLGCWRTRLACPGVSEAILFCGMVDPNLRQDVQEVAGRALLRAMGAVWPPTFGGALTGFWTTDPCALITALKRSASVCPAEDKQMEDALRKLLHAGIPALDLLTAQGSPVRRLPHLKLWVRRRARHRDAAYILLLREGAPLSAKYLGEQVGLVPRAMSANLTRDHRFQQVRPSGDWGLSEWGDKNQPTPATALEAITQVLRVNGPMAERPLIAQVLQRYPASVWQIKRGIEGASQIGRFEDGTIGLIDQGAVHSQLVHRHRRPKNLVRHEGPVLEFFLPVTASLIRGSGTMLSPYIGAALGLTDSRPEISFVLNGERSVRVKRHMTLTQMSSVRQLLLDHGARLGERAVFVFDIDQGTVQCRIAAR